MYLLDTNVISELRKAKSGRIDRHVRDWAKQVDADALYLSAISILELELGIPIARTARPDTGPCVALLDGGACSARLRGSDSISGYSGCATLRCFSRAESML